MVSKLVLVGGREFEQPLCDLHVLPICMNGSPKRTIFICLSVSPHVEMRPHMRKGDEKHNMQIEPKSASLIFQKIVSSKIIIIIIVM